MLRTPRYTKEYFASRGKEIYAQSILPKLDSSDANKYVAIDIETGDFERDTSDFAASQRLLVRCPDAQIWLERVGHSTARRF